MTSPLWPLTTTFSEYYKGNSYLCLTTLTTSSVAQAALTPHFHMVHLCITLLPHPHLLLEHFTARRGLPVSLIVFQSTCIVLEGKLENGWLIHCICCHENLLDRNGPSWSVPGGREVCVKVCVSMHKLHTYSLSLEKTYFFIYIIFTQSTHREHQLYFISHHTVKTYGLQRGLEGHSPFYLIICLLKGWKCPIKSQPLNKLHMVVFP